MSEQAHLEPIESTATADMCIREVQVAAIESGSAVNIIDSRKRTKYLALLACSVVFVILGVLGVQKVIIRKIYTQSISKSLEESLAVKSKERTQPYVTETESRRLTNQEFERRRVYAPEVFKHEAPKVYINKIVVEKGKVIGRILEEYNVSNFELANVIKAAQLQGVNLTRLHPKQLIEISYTKDQSGAVLQVTEIDVILNEYRKLKLTKVMPDKDYQASIVEIPFSKEFVFMRGKIKNNIFISAARQGVPVQNLMESISACGYDVDFQRDIKAGDSFEILVEKFTSLDNYSTHFGKTIYFALTRGGNKYRIYRFKQADGEDFFTSEYKSARRGLLKTPVPRSKITSKFCMRKHPLFGYSHMHQGVDFAAPQGTPIYAAGPGIVVELGSKKCLGNYVKIKHSNDLSTLYGHASRFAKGLTIGARVKQGQAIAFVGMTGRATGPHLHYGLIYQGQYIDPLKFKTQSLKTLRGKELEAFKVQKAKIDSIVQDRKTPKEKA